MRVVNLASRPFLNRRPVRRIVVFLWVVGAVLGLSNAWLYGEYLRGTTLNRARLAELDAEIESADQAATAVSQRLQRLDLAERNQRIEFLNDLIGKRTFPWSRLFDDLEDVLLDDVYLRSVAPRVADDEETGVRRRVMTPAEARERARRQRRGTEPEAADDVPEEAAAPEPELVDLSLDGFARSDEALLDFVDALYAAEHFLEPYLSAETRRAESREVNFRITVRYLLPATPPPPPLEMPETVEASADGSAGPAGPAGPAGAETSSAGEGTPIVVVEPDAGETATETPADTASEPAVTPPPASVASSPERRPLARRPAPTAGGTAETRSATGAATGRQEQRPSRESSPQLVEPAASAARTVGRGSSGRPTP